MALKELEPSASSDPEVLRIREKRYRKEKGRDTDRFFRAWVMLKVSAQDPPGFLNQKRKARELQECMDDLCLLDFPVSDALIAEWDDFLRTWLRSCYESRSFRSMAFGLLTVSDEVLTERIVNEINMVTRTAPGALGKEEAFLPLRREAIRVFAEMLKDGDALRERYFPGE